MIEGLRLLPRVLYCRDRQKEEFDDPYADTYLDCTDCIERHRADVRKRMGCGYVMGSEAPRDMPEFLGDVSECPGRLIRLPVVQEVAHAAYWAETGQLGLYYEGADLPRNLFEYISSLEASKRMTEGDAIREVKREAKQEARNGSR